MLETSVPGILATGDMRRGAAEHGGAGALALQFILSNSERRDCA
jgi:hypothetical protein